MTVCGAGNDRKGLVVDLVLPMSHALSPSLRLNTGVATAWTGALKWRLLERP